MCGEMKELSFFYTDRSRHSGKSSKCKVCQNRFNSSRNKGRQKTNSTYKLRCVYMNRIKKNMTERGFMRTQSNLDILGCSWVELKEYLESEFKENMSWENYGEWHIDHVIPHSYAEDVYEFNHLNHYLNLQPLWSQENASKSNKLLSEVNVPKIYKTLEYMIKNKGIHKLVSLYLNEKFKDIIKSNVIFEDSIIKIHILTSTPILTEDIQKDLSDNLSLENVLITLEPHL